MLKSWLDKLRTKAPVLMTPWGPVSESARFQAAMNMLADPAIRFRVEEYFIKKHGGNREAGLAECKHNYPEAYLKA